jgi:hypothetical protein
MKTGLWRSQGERDSEMKVHRACPSLDSRQTLMQENASLVFTTSQLLNYCCPYSHCCV